MESKIKENHEDVLEELANKTLGAIDYKKMPLQFLEEFCNRVRGNRCIGPVSVGDDEPDPEADGFLLYVELQRYVPEIKVYLASKPTNHPGGYEMDAEHKAILETAKKYEGLFNEEDKQFIELVQAEKARR